MNTPRGHLHGKVLLWIMLPAAVFMLAAVAVILLSLSSISQRFVLVLLMGMILVTPALALGMALKPVTTALDNLICALTRLGAGELGLTTTADTDDEVQTAAEAFNAASTQLKTRFGELEARLQEQESQAVLAETLEKAPGLEAAVQAALEEVLAHLDMETGQVWLVDKTEGAKKAIKSVAQSGLTGELRAVLPVLGQAERLAGEALAQGRPVVLTGQAQPGSGEMQAWAATPLMEGEKTWGALVVGTRRERTLTAAELAQLETLGQLLGRAIARRRQAEAAEAAQARLLAELKTAQGEAKSLKRELSLSNAVLEATTSNQDTQAVLEEVCRALVTAFEANQSAAALLDPSGETLTVKAEYGHADSPRALGVVIPVENNPATLYVLKQKTPLAVCDAQHDILMMPVQALMKERGVVSLLLLPIVAGGAVIGTIGLDFGETREFSDDEIALAARVSAAAALALEIARLKQALQASEALAAKFSN